MIASVGLNGAPCEGPPLSECRLPGFGQFTTDEQRAVAIQPREDFYGDIWDPSLAVSWIAMIAIIVVVVAILLVIVGLQFRLLSGKPERK